MMHDLEDYFTHALNPGHYWALVRSHSQTLVEKGFTSGTLQGNNIQTVGFAVRAVSQN